MTVARWLETDSLSNQNIASAAAIGAYTADADRMIVCDVSLDQVAGNGDYVIYLTRQINGAGSAYVLLPKTTCTAASGETAIAMQSGPVTVRSGDVVTVYIDGLAGDTTTPDTTVRWFEMAALRPATAGRTLAVDASGLVDLVNAPNATALAAVVAAIDADPPSVNVTLWKDAAAGDAPATYADLSELVSHGDAEWATADVSGLASAATAQAILEDTDVTLPALINTRATLGTGTVTWTYTLTSSADDTPIADADVWVTTDVGGSNVIASGQTDQNGEVTFELDPGTVYVWRQKSGWNFSNPDTEVVS